MKCRLRKRTGLEPRKSPEAGPLRLVRHGGIISIDIDEPLTGAAAVGQLVPTGMPPNTDLFVDPAWGDWFVSVIPSGKRYGFKFAVPADEDARFYLTFFDDADIVVEIDNDLHLEKASQQLRRGDRRDR